MKPITAEILHPEIITECCKNVCIKTKSNQRVGCHTIPVPEEVVDEFVKAVNTLTAKPEPENPTVARRLLGDIKMLLDMRKGRGVLGMLDGDAIIKRIEADYTQAESQLADAKQYDPKVVEELIEWAMLAKNISLGSVYRNYIIAKLQPEKIA